MSQHRNRAEVSQRTGRLALRAVREFAFVPSIVVAAFIVLAVIAILADQTHLALFDGLRSLFGTVIGADASTAALQSIATGLLTVTSITFSVLLLAVQQTASNLSPVVFDQFVRRRINQLLLGFFVGLSLFAYVVMVAVKDSMPPIVGAGIATVLTVVGMLLLLVLVYVTVDQMRPSNVVRQIHDRTLAARDAQRPLRERTRRCAGSDQTVRATCHSVLTGYVTAIDLDRLEAALADAPDAEIRLEVQLGGGITYGDVIATVADGDTATAERLADAVSDSVVIDRRRDIDRDATTGVHELVNIAWTSGSTSKQSPEVALEGLDMLRDLASRWMADPQPDGPSEGTLAVVYRDDDLDQVMQALFSLMVVAHESHQHLTAARVLDAYRSLLGRAEPGLRDRMLEDIERMQDLLEQLPSSGMLEKSRADLAAAVRSAGGRQRAGA
ncbi:DUF2254 family protein [Nocardioides mesophilus]|uniref:DUF2254 domain-containing protein n=1 Tax=Nocardioides mesophilus TaxID=433659 RepID=A0A7G9RB51_9ACTN|nr:DUF2254 family protein [Nocardioides mesophilus]QNN52826.1 DUF2254 domain-containing protein [Nocardioides mesophilus]